MKNSKRRALMLRLFRIEKGEDAGLVLSLGEFLDANEGYESALSALDIGETFSDGGGAAPLWTIRRIE